MKIVKKTVTVIAILLAALLVIVAILGCCVLTPSSLGVEKPELSSAYGTVLSDINGIQETNPRYIDIACLGSHDSFSSLLTADSLPDENAPDALRVLRPVLKNYIYRFAVTQNEGIYNQIMQGARFLQLKVTVYQGEWYTSHTFLSGKLETHLLDILRYLVSDQAKGEIVGVLFQPVYLGNKTYADMHEYIASVRYNGKNIYDFVNYSPVDVFNKGDGGVRINDLRYNDVTANGERASVVLFDRRDNNYKPTWEGTNDAFPYSFDMDSNAIHVWHDSSTPKQLVKGIEQTCKDIRSDDKNFDLLRVNQTQAAMATHTFSDIVNDLTAGSLLKIAKEHNLTLLERTDFDEMLTTMPIFQVDYLTSTYGDFNNKANALIRAHNENLCK